MKKSRDNQDNESSGWCLWEWGKRGREGGLWDVRDRINGDGTWVVSTKCCAAEVDPQCFQMAKIAKNGQTRKSSRGCGAVAISALLPTRLTRSRRV